MSCKFIVGGRGSGKTKEIYAEIFAALQKEKKKVFLIVPEQSTFYHEKNIDVQRQGRSLWNLEITSFRRLAEKTVAEPVLSPLGQHLALYRCLTCHKDKFLSFKINEISPGFIDAVLSAIEEILINDLSSDDLRDKAEELSNSDLAGDLPKKLMDTAIILDYIKENSKEANFDGNLLLKKFSDSLVMSGDGLKDTLFFFDDFSDFMAIEYDIIEKLVKLGIPLTFSFMLEPGRGQFRKSLKAMERIESIAAAYSYPVEKMNLSKTVGDRAIIFLADNCLGSEVPYCANSDAINIFHSDEIAGEIEGIAREICQLKEQGYKNSDISLSFRDITSYLPHIKEVFQLYNLDFYIDEPVSLQNNPVFLYSLSLLRLVADKWSYASVFALLKSGFFPLAQDECDELENYCLAHGIKGKAFYGDTPLTYIGSREEVDLEKINHLRDSVRDFLMPFQEKLKRAETAKDYAAVIWDFLAASEVDSTLEIWCSEREKRGDILKATELSSSLTSLAELLSQMVIAFNKEKLSLKAFYEILAMGCQVQKLRTIPQRVNDIEINVLGQSRPAAAKVVFIGGVNEGIFPNYTCVEGFFNRNDREILGRSEDFWYRNKKFFYDNENSLMYQGISRAQEKLYLSYIESTGDDVESQSLGPSILIYTAKNLFPNIEDKFVSADLSYCGDDSIFYSIPRVITLLPYILRETASAESWQEIADFLAQNDSTSAKTDFALSSLVYTGKAQKLTGATIERYLRNTLYMNVSSMDVYRKCPFSYFAKYGLRLRERRELKFEAPNLGEFYHDALRCLVEKMISENIPWSNLPSIGHELISGIIEKKLVDFGEHTLFSEEKKGFIAGMIKDNLFLAVDIMSRQIEKGDKFYPIRCEASFGPNEEFEAKAYSLDDSGREVILTGQIDRIDLADGDGKKYVRIIDYKTGGKDLRMDDIYYGINLQLLVYLLIVEYNGIHGQDIPLEPGGIFYFSTKDLFINIDEEIDDKQLREKLDKASQMSGYIIGGEDVDEQYPDDAKQRHLNHRQYKILQEYLDSAIKRIGQEIFDGVNTISPYYHNNVLSCRYCAYESLCGYEERLQGKPVILYSIKEEEAEAKIKAAVSRGKKDEIYT